MFGLLICSSDRLNDKWRNAIPDSFIHENLNTELIDAIILRSQALKRLGKIDDVTIIIDDKTENISKDRCDQLSAYAKCIVCDIQKSEPMDYLNDECHSKMWEYHSKNYNDRSKIKSSESERV